jgi:D-sedoheptulose 7-phosphate isomerase
MDPEATVHAHFDGSIEAKQRARTELAGAVTAAADRIGRSLEGGGKVLACGNGGSAGDAMHLASELINRFERERTALPAWALTADSPTLTSIANDRHYDEVFARQVEALGRSGDVLVAITTSGQSPNVTAAARAAQAAGMTVVALSGKDGGPVAQALDADDVEIRAPSTRTARIQEIHLVVIHSLCDLVDQRLFEPG